MPRLFAAPRRWHTRSMHTQPPLPPTPQSLPPRPSYFTVHTLYPFLLLSCFTSLVLNLGHGKAGLNDERGQLEARISVLDALVGRYKLAQESSRTAGNGLAGDELWTEEELEAMERELELVGLGRAKGKSVEEVDGESISWKEVFLGKKGKEWEEPVTKEEDTDWSAVFQAAEEADKAALLPPAPLALPVPRAPLPSTRTRPPSATAATYL